VSDTDRLTTRFEIAVANFCRSAFNLAANEKAYQAWLATSVIHEFGISRVYREVHLLKSQLAHLATPEVMEGFTDGNELFPDLSVSWEEAIDARHTAARPPHLDAGAMLGELAVVTEFKATASTSQPTTPTAIRRDLRKLGPFTMAARSKPDRTLAAYLVVLDNHRRTDGTLTGRYRTDRMEQLLDTVKRTWPVDLPAPRVVVGWSDGGPLTIDHYQGFEVTGNL
jgi:hypothetical protein